MLAISESVRRGERALDEKEKEKRQKAERKGVCRMMLMACGLTRQVEFPLATLRNIQQPTRNAKGEADDAIRTALFPFSFTDFGTWK